MATSTNHKFEVVVTMKVKCLKNHALMMSRLDELEKLGRDAASRLKKDPKFKVLADVSQHVAANDKIFADIAQWESGHPDELSQAVAQDLTPTAELAALAVDVVKKLKNRAPSEKDTMFTDCVEHKAAEFVNLLTEVMANLRAVSKGYYMGGPSDWKANLQNNSAVNVVVAKAASTLLTIPMDQMKSAIANAEKATFLIQVAVAFGSRLLYAPSVLTQGLH